MCMPGAKRDRQRGSMPPLERGLLTHEVSLPPRRSSAPAVRDDIDLSPYPR
jgi:hypothetical protein